MNRQMPPRQLTTSELSREIAALEVALLDLPAGSSHGQEGGRLEMLYAEREERNRLAERHPRTAQRQFPDDAS